MNPVIETPKDPLPKDFFLYSEQAVGKIPDEIKPLLELMNLVVECLDYSPLGMEAVRYWKISNPKTLKFAP